ncbi:MAG TPA: LysM peptidoglycan-binding domain-containing protein, partial [Ramlibacter sp.]|nr:LysM peptidoglycan-binding domain-containing protein [Ramlibacter sp.]
MLVLRSQGWMWVGVAVLVGGLIAGCASSSRTPAPVEDRSPGARSQPQPQPQPPAVVVEPAKQLPGAENVGKPGYYTVRPGDTLIRIALDSGQNWRDVARWNNIDNPNVIEVGQVLRVIPPAGMVTDVAAARPPAPAPTAPGATATPPAAAGATRPAPAGTVASIPPASPTPAPS